MQNSFNDAPSRFAVSWGVECEFVLAFHRDRLRHVLSYFDDVHRPSVMSDDDDIDHETLLREANGEFGRSQAWCFRQRWPTSLLAVHDADTPLTAKEDISKEFTVPWFHYEMSDPVISRKYSGRKYHRTFALEPMLLAQDILHQSWLSVKPVALTVPPGETRYGLLVNSNRDDDSQTLLYPDLLRPEVVLPEDQLIYDTWILTQDWSVPPSEKSELQSKFGLSVRESPRWDSSGIELISPKFDRNGLDNAIQELKNIFHALSYHKHDQEGISGSPQQRLSAQNEGYDGMNHQYSGGYGAVESVFAGTHVHIGLNLEHQSISPLLILKHIAFIALANEELISSVHPYRRRGWPVKEVSPLSEVFPFRKTLSSAQEKQYRIMREETRMSELTDKYVTAWSLHSNRRWFIKKVYRTPPSTPGDAIWNHNDQYDQLADYILDPNLSVRDFFESVQENSDQDGCFEGHHGSIIDFSRVARNMGLPTTHNRKPPCTIEFRQHGCTLDADEIKHWVQFLFALVDLAQRRAYQKTDYRGYPLVNSANEKTKYGGPIQSIEELCGPDNLNLPPEEVQYWKSRADRYADEERRWNQKMDSRRRKRALDKANHGRKLNNKDFVAMAPLLNPRRSYRNMSRDDLLKQFHEKLDLEEGHIPDLPRFYALATKKRSELSDLLIQMDTNLLVTGFYSKASNLDKDNLPRIT